MRIRFLLGMLGLTLCGMVMVIQAGEQDKQGAPSAAQKAELAAQQQQLGRQFEEFQLLMLKLMQRMQRGTAEEQTRAKAIGRILDDVQKGSLKTQFDQLAEQLRTSKLTNTSELKELKQRAERLTEELQRILRMFQEDPRSQQLREEAQFLKDMITKLGKIIDEQKQVQARTERAKSDQNELHKNQGQISKDIDKANKAIDKFLGKNVEGVAQDPKNLKGGPKEGGKNEKSSAVAKGDGEKETQTAQAEAKPGGDEKPTQVASAKPDEPSDGSKEGDAQAKQGDGAQGSQAKAGKESNGSESSQAKPNQGAKGSEAGSKANDGAKNPTASAKPSQGSKGSPSKGASQAKAGEGKAGSKPGEGSKSSQAKASSGQPSQGSKASQGQAKSGSTSKGQATAKNDGSQKSPQGNQSQPTAKQDSGDHGAQSAKITVNDGEGKSPGNQKTKDELGKNQKKVLEAGYESIKAENEIVQGKKKPAIEKQDKVIDNLQQVKENLEKLLRQTREEELERLLAALEARCRKMLEMQLAVLAGTEQTHKAILLRAEKKAGREEQQASLRLSDQEKDIIGEANKAIQMLEEEGSAVAFPEVFQQVREDMKHVQRRLEIADVAEVTQQVEKDIVESLKEMIEALKKAIQQNKSSGKPGQPPPNADQKLLDKIAELKMIRSLQKRVNDRTQFYGRLFPSEQAMDLNIRQSLQQLAERQERIFEIMDRFAKGDGK